ADAHVRDGFDSRHDEADLAGAERVGGPFVWRKMSQAHHLAALVGAHQQNFHADAQLAAEDPDQADDALVHVVPTVEDERADGLAAGFRRGYSRDNRLQDVVDAHAFLGAGENRFGGVEPDDFLDLLAGALDIGAGQIDLVDHRNNFQPVIEREINVGERLRLDPLARIDHQQRALARGQAARNFVGEIDVAGRIDQVQYVAF